MFDDDDKSELKDQAENFWWISIDAATSTLGAAGLLIYFVSLEFKQMVLGGLDYFGDYWNCIDSSSILLNSAFLGLFAVNQLCCDAVFSA